MGNFSSIYTQRFTRNAFFLLSLLGLTLPSRALDSYIIFGAGSVNQGMAGAGTASAQSPLGGIMWNPAALLDLPNQKQVELGLEVVFANAETETRLPTPNGPLKGSMSSDLDVFPPLPYFGLILPASHPDTLYHIGAIPMFGFGVDYPTDNRPPPKVNLILSPPPFGFGQIESFHALERFSFGVSRKVNDRWAVGASLIAAVSFLELKPAVFAPPDDANGDGIPSYPDADLEESYGFGAQIGVQYQISENMVGGFSAQTPIWLDRFEFDAVDELGGPRPISFNLDAPAILSSGLAFLLGEKTTVAVDVRYIPFSQTEGFKEEMLDETGALRGLGFDDIWTAKLGIQHTLNSDLTLRGGYSYAENAVPDRNVFFGIPAPVIAEHHFTAGFSFPLNERVQVHGSCWYSLENDQSGPAYSPGNIPIPGSRVTNRVEAYSVSTGISMMF